MPESSMDWWDIAGVVVAVVAALIAWRTLAKTGRPVSEKTVQTMTNSVDGEQEATKPNVAQTMDGSKGGKQKA